MAESILLRRREFIDDNDSFAAAVSEDVEGMVMWSREVLRLAGAGNAEPKAPASAAQVLRR